MTAKRMSTRKAPLAFKLRGLSILGLAAGTGLVISAQNAGAAPFTAAAREEAPAGQAGRDYYSQLAYQISMGLSTDLEDKVEAANLWQSNSHPLPRTSVEDLLVQRRQVAPYIIAPNVGTYATAQGQPVHGNVPKYSQGGGDGTQAATHGRSGPLSTTNNRDVHSVPHLAPVSPEVFAGLPTQSTQDDQAISAALEAAGVNNVASSPPPIATLSQVSVPPQPSATAPPSTSASTSQFTASASTASASSVSPSNSAKPTPDPPTRLMANMQHEKNKDGNELVTHSVFSPKNKLFPLAVAGIASASLLFLLAFIAIARAVAHGSLRREQAKNAGSDYQDKADRLTSAAPGLSAARSIRRAITKKKLGSFARRQHDGSVLIDVGDEVFAVPEHLAESYRHEMIRERKALSLGSGSHGSDESIPDGPFGRIKLCHLKGGGPDVEGWRAKLAYDQQVNGGGTSKPTRSLSQRLVDRLRSISRKNMMDEGDHNEKGAAKEAFSFDTSRQSKGALRQGVLSSQVPIVTNGSSEWTVAKVSAAKDEQLKGSQNEDARPKFDVARKPVRYNENRKSKSWDGSEVDADVLNARLMDLEKQVGSHDRRQRNDAEPMRTNAGTPVSVPAPALHKAQRQSADQRKRVSAQSNTAGPRPKPISTSTNVASPQLFQSRQSIGQRLAIQMHPESPASAGASTEDLNLVTAKALRPLPLPPQLSALVP